MKKRRLMIDTNAYSALMSGHDGVIAALNDAIEVLVPIAVLGELHDGFRGGAKMAENLKTLKSFLAKPSVKVVNATQATAERYGEIKSALSKTGHPVPINDIWIAAQALERNVDILTFDHHFRFMEICGVASLPQGDKVAYEHDKKIVCRRRGGACGCARVSGEA